ncbi:hypothetical protein LCGC14_0863060 [marine sediment metagenome]|uniref:DNA methylase N-4/N-6 domain-containing protein n=1 Tax=marine sediment metagenome TaxID=412755 RepID=A0A0F9PBW3_9ZZZZ
MELNKIYQGNCLELMKQIEDNSVDLILCDLPYGTTACSWDAIIPFKELWGAYYRIIRPNGFIILTASQPSTTKLINSNIDNFSHQWIWEKEQGANPLLANVQPMKNFEDVIVFSNEHNHDFTFNNPLRLYFRNIIDYIGLNRKALMSRIGQKIDHTTRINSTQFNLCTRETYLELMNVFQIDKMQGFKTFNKLEEINNDFLNKYPRVYNPQKINGKQYTSGKGYLEHLGFEKEGGTISSERYPTSIIKFNTDKTKSKHPTQKPVALFEYLIKTYTNEGNLVLDNCAGSGTTGVACLRTNRSFILIEKEGKYVEIAKERLKQGNLNTLFQNKEN